MGKCVHFVSQCRSVTVETDVTCSVTVLYRVRATVLVVVLVSIVGLGRIALVWAIAVSEP